MSVEQIVINQDLFVTVVISGFGVLMATLVTVLIITGKLLFNKLDKKIEYGYTRLDDRVKPLVESVNHAHNRITEHVENYHT